MKSTTRIILMTMAIAGLVTVNNAVYAHEGHEHEVSDFNSVTVYNDDKVDRVIISGIKGSGKDSIITVNTLLPAATVDLPEQYQNLKPGSVSQVQFTGLREAKLGDKIGINLPEGQIQIVNDQQITHSNGDQSFIGHLDGYGPEYQTVLSMDQKGNIVGTITSSNGEYMVESDGNGKTWMLDVGYAGLQYLHQEGHGPKLGDIAATTTTVPNMNSTVPVYGTVPATTIDMLIYYTSGLKTPDLIINNIVTASNQAFVNSKVNIQLRVIARLLVDSSESIDTSSAQDDLILANGPFSKIKATRDQYGADIITLLRPFKSSHLYCGMSYLNTYLDPERVFNAVSYGVSSRGVCGVYSLIHETGHTLGSGHDIPSISGSVNAVYPFSYGYSAQGRFGTIMSYMQPRIGMFSNPNTICYAYSKIPCGKANVADNARSFNLVAKTVAAFRPTKVK